MAAMSSTKTAIVVLSDPRAGDEALGRLFNALAATYDFKQKHQDVQLIFQGTGTRWTGLLTKTDHPAHALYKAVEDKVAGVSAGCAVAFGASEDAEQNGFIHRPGEPKGAGRQAAFGEGAVEHDTVGADQRNQHGRRGQQISQASRPVALASPVIGVDVLPDQRDLAGARLRKVLDFAQNLADGP